MVFQSADEALNPYRTVGATLRRPLRRLRRLSAGEVEERLVELLAAVKLSPDYGGRLPAQLSGGEKQRVAVARAFASEPDLILFDESVSGLDVSVQAAILNLLSRLQIERATSYLFISHDLAVVSYLADEIAVIYRGRLMEFGPAGEVLAPPYHPYTEALLSAIPLPDPSSRREPIRLHDLNGPARATERGCPFHARCPRFLGQVCVEEAPPRREIDGKEFYCHIPPEELRTVQETAPTPTQKREESQGG
jgi:peptide/nickel transport system ATP-binding protein